MKKIFSAVSVAFFCLSAVAGNVIQPGVVWPDDRNQHVQAHGGGITRVGDTFYWYGEDRSQDNLADFRCVSCYSSINLVDWSFRRQVVKLTDPENLGAGWILERPKVFYNASSGKFVMYAHIDDGKYKLARVAVFTSDTADGDYHYKKMFRPFGHESRDIGQFVDDDGTAYLISEDRPNGFHIYQLSEDYMSLAKDVCLIPEHLEGGALVHYGSLYYVIGSHLSGWNPNPNVYAAASSLAGPWSEFKDIAPSEKKTYGSQSSMLLKIAGTKTTSVIFMGDIWEPEAQWDSRYLWMPLKINSTNLSLPAPQPWTVNIKTGEAKLK